MVQSTATSQLIALDDTILQKSEEIHTYRKAPEIVTTYEATRPQKEQKFMNIVRKWEKRLGFVTPLKWKSIINIFVLHLLPFTWIVYMVKTGDYCHVKTLLMAFVFTQIAGFGITGGAHRYWTHRSYKPTLPLQWILALCFSMAGQNNIFQWVRDHRVHHKFSDTSADPHNIKRGFFFSHMGWLMMKKHPDVIKEGNKMNLDDIKNDPVVKFQTKYFIPLKLLFSLVIPIFLLTTLLNEKVYHAFLCHLAGIVYSLHCTWAVNSFAHMWGSRPYDKTMYPAENVFVAFFAIGEGWHNYHHTFPWDYKTSELMYTLNLTTCIINGFAKLGWVYDMKTASPSLVKAVARNRGHASEKLEKGYTTESPHHHDHFTP